MFFHKILLIASMGVSLSSSSSTLTTKIVESPTLEEQRFITMDLEKYSELSVLKCAHSRICKKFKLSGLGIEGFTIGSDAFVSLKGLYGLTEFAKLEKLLSKRNISKLFITSDVDLWKLTRLGYTFAEDPGIIAPCLDRAEKKTGVLSHRVYAHKFLSSTAFEVPMETEMSIVEERLDHIVTINDDPAESPNLGIVTYDGEEKITAAMLANKYPDIDDIYIEEIYSSSKDIKIKSDLLKTLEKYALESGFKKLSLCTCDPETLKFYIKNGFYIFSVFPFTDSLEGDRYISGYALMKKLIK